MVKKNSNSILDNILQIFPEWEESLGYFASEMPIVEL